MTGNEQLQTGTRVILWGRPEEDLILLFGEGYYEGTTYFNGNDWPVIRLLNGQEVTIHQLGVSVGRADSVARTCSHFKGDVIEWDLSKYLSGQRPTRDQRLRNTKPGQEPAAPPKTATDKVLLLKQEIAIEQQRIELARELIAKAEATITAKQQEMNALTHSVLGELAAVNPELARLMAGLPPPPSTPVIAPIAPTAPQTVAPKVKPIVAESPPVDDHTMLAVED